MIKTIVKVTRAQMIALENGDPVGTHTYDPDHCLYMVDDGLELPTTNGSYVITTSNNGNSFSYTPSAINITYAALKTLRNNGQLTPGAQYRITDYQCTTTTQNTSVANHVFDIIVTAQMWLNSQAFEILGYCPYDRIPEDEY